MAIETERLTDLKCRDCLHYKLTGWWDPQRVCEIGGFPVNKDGPACISVNPKTQNKMARPAIEIVSDVKRKIDKERKRGDFRPAPYCDSKVASDLCNPSNYGGNNKSEWIKKLSAAAAHILCEIETIQAIKGDGIRK